MTQRCWVVKRGAGQMRGPIRKERPAFTHFRSCTAVKHLISHLACDPHGVYPRLMSAAGKASQAAQYALRSTTGAARDAAKIPFSKDAFTSKPTAFEVKGITYDHPISTDGQRSTPTEANAQGSATRDASSKDPALVNEKRPQATPSQLLRYFYDPNPTAINNVTFASTRMIAEDPSHPYHIRTIRRLQAFDPSILHWRVHIPIDVSKKSAIRNWAKKRVVRAMVKQLEDMGLERDGGVEDGKDGEGLRGALLILLSKDAKVALGFSDEQVMEDLASVLQAVREKQRSGKRMGPASAPLRQRPAIYQR